MPANNPISTVSAMTDVSMTRRVALIVMDAPTRNGKFGDFIHDDEAISVVRATIAAMRDHMTDGMVSAWANAHPPETVVGMSDEDANRAAALADWNAMLDAALGEG